VNWDHPILRPVIAFCARLVPTVASHAGRNSSTLTRCERTEIVTRRTPAIHNPVQLVYSACLPQMRTEFCGKGKHAGWGRGWLCKGGKV
jgi:hypothetical protein